MTVATTGARDCDPSRPGDRICANRYRSRNTSIHLPPTVTIRRL